MEIITYLNFFLMEKLKQQFPSDRARQSRMSIIEIEPGTQLLWVRMAYICFLASHKVNGVSFEHTTLLKNLVFRDFHEMYPSRII